MNWPSKLDVIIEGDEPEDLKEVRVTFLREAQLLHPERPYCYVGVYETPDGDRLGIEDEYMSHCKEKNIVPRIPAMVLQRNAETKARMEAYQASENARGSQAPSGLVLPPGYQV